MTGGQPALEQSCRAYFERYPETRYIDLLLHDTNGIFRGKRIPREALPGICREGLLLPGSLHALDIRGLTPQSTGLGFDDGDADRPCRPLAGSLRPVPWLGPRYAQMQLEMYEPDGGPFFADARQRLREVLAGFTARALRPVLAVELEFFIVDPVRGPDGQPQPVVWESTGRRTLSTQMNGMTDLAEYAGLLEAITETAAAQGIATGTLLTEYGPGQFEVNLPHQADALAACDQAVCFKRVVKAVAAAHGREATFMAKPYDAQAGSGLHLHLSLLDSDGRNLFSESAGDPGPGAPALGHAAAGLLWSMPEGMALFAPNVNSYRRFQAESYVPMSAAWGVNNRGVALRVPAGGPAARRLEHRVAGADANVYLVAAWVLAGVLDGLQAAREPPAPLDGNAYTQPGVPLPCSWPEALAAFEGSALARQWLGTRFVDMYLALKRAEMEAFAARVTPLECQWYLPHL